MVWVRLLPSLYNVYSNCESDFLRRVDHSTKPVLRNELGLSSYISILFGLITFHLVLLYQLGSPYAIFLKAQEFFPYLRTLTASTSIGLIVFRELAPAPLKRSVKKNVMLEALFAYWVSYAMLDGLLTYVGCYYATPTESNMALLYRFLRNQLIALPFSRPGYVIEYVADYLGIISPG